MSSAATVETFSIMSTRGRVVKCNASGFAETCTEARPEELRCRVEKPIPNVEVSRLIKRIVIRSICQLGSMFVLLWLLLEVETPSEFKQEKTVNGHPSCQIPLVMIFIKFGALNGNALWFSGHQFALFHTEHTHGHLSNLSVCDSKREGSQSSFHLAVSSSASLSAAATPRAQRGFAWS